MKEGPSVAAVREFLMEAVPFWKTLALELKEVQPGRAVFEGTVHPGLLQNKVLHGGVLASIADSACAVAAISLVHPARYATTINLQVSYLRPVVAGRFRAEGECVKAGKTIFFCEAKVFEETGQLACLATSQLMAIPNSSK